MSVSNNFIAYILPCVLYVAVPKKSTVGRAAKSQEFMTMNPKASTATVEEVLLSYLCHRRRKGSALQETLVVEAMGYIASD